MKTLLPLAALAAVASLAACKSEPEVVSSRAPDPLAEQKANAPVAELPPPIKASVSFRCKDNSVVFIDFFQGDKMANFRSKSDGSPIQLKAPAAGEPLVADGYKLTGTPKSITLTQPGKGELTCRT